MNSKWADPKLWTVFVGGVVSIVNAYFGWHIDPEKLIATTSVIVSYLITQGIVDRKKAANGTVKYTFNSEKFVVMVFVAGIMGISQIVHLDISEEWLWSGAVGAAAFFGVKGAQDIKLEKQKGAKQDVGTDFSYTAGDNR